MSDPVVRVDYFSDLQKLYGNVGYRIVEANIQELLRDKRDMASWC